MNGNKLEFDKANHDRRTIEQIVERELKENSPFNVKVIGTPGEGTVNYKASSDRVIVDESPNSIRVDIRANAEAQMAIEEALKSQSGSNASTQQQSPSMETERMGTTANVSNEPMGEVSAKMTLRDDGHIDIDWGDRTMHIDTMMGVFVPKPTDDRDQPLVYVDEDTSLTETMIDEAVEKIREQLRQYV
jgi:hypothetical protein